MQHFLRADLEAVRAAGQTLPIEVLSAATLASDVMPELAVAPITDIAVRGTLHASPAIKAALARRI